MSDCRCGLQRFEQMSAALGKPALKVLIVEDEMLIAFDLELQVEASGHKVIGLAYDMASCKNAVLDNIPDVALMDLRLKGGECGEDVARWLKDEFAVRCIFVSGNLDKERREHLKVLDPVAFVGKPVLTSLLTEALAQARPRAAME